MRTGTVSTTFTRRPVIVALAALAGLLAVLALAGPAAAATSCGRQVIDDWYDDGRVDGTYELHCYDDAIEALPRDVRDYSSAKDDITRALQNRMRGEPAPPAETDPSPTDDPDTPTSNETDDPVVETGRPRKSRPTRPRRSDRSTTARARAPSRCRCSSSPGSRSSWSRAAPPATSSAASAAGTCLLPRSELAAQVPNQLPQVRDATALKASAFCGRDSPEGHSRPVEW